MIKLHVEIGASQNEIHSVAARPLQGAESGGFVPGNTYRALVTGKTGGLTELMIGGRYLLARSAFNFQIGQSVSLQLAEARPDLLIFRLAGAVVQAAGREKLDLETSMARAGIKSSPDSVRAAGILFQAGVRISAGPVGMFVRLAQEYGEARLPVVAMIYAKLAAAGANPPYSTLAAIASYIAAPPSLGKALDDLRKMRERRGETRLNDALGALIVRRGGAAAEDIRAILEFLLSPPERDFAGAILEFEESEQRDGAEEIEIGIGGFSALAAKLGADSPVAGDGGERAAIESLTAQIEALNVLNALPDEAVAAEIPIEIGDEAASAVLEYRGGTGAAYGEDFAALLTIETKELGKIEAHIVRRAGAIRTSVMAENLDTLEALERASGGEKFAAKIAKSCGVRDAEAVIERLRSKPALIADGTKRPAENER